MMQMQSQGRMEEERDLLLLLLLLLLLFFLLILDLCGHSMSHVILWLITSTEVQYLQ